jgi:hypothetical protein
VHKRRQQATSSSNKRQSKHLRLSNSSNSNKQYGCSGAAKEERSKEVAARALAMWI